MSQYFSLCRSPHGWPRHVRDLDPKSVVFGDMSIYARERVDGSVALSDRK
jgi:hypothetical protein